MVAGCRWPGLLMEASGPFKLIHPFRRLGHECADDGSVFDVRAMLALSPLLPVRVALAAPNVVLGPSIYYYQYNNSVRIQ